MHTKRLIETQQKYSEILIEFSLNFHSASISNQNFIQLQNGENLASIAFVLVNCLSIQSESNEFYHFE